MQEAKEVKRGRAFIFVCFLLILAFFLKAAGAEEVLTWQDCLREASQNHPDLISAKEVINQDKADKVIAQSENFGSFVIIVDISWGLVTRNAGESLA